MLLVRYQSHNTNSTFGFWKLFGDQWVDPNGLHRLSWKGCKWKPKQQSKTSWIIHLGYITMNPWASMEPCWFVAADPHFSLSFSFPLVWRAWGRWELQWCSCWRGMECFHVDCPSVCSSDGLFRGIKSSSWKVTGNLKALFFYKTWYQLLCGWSQPKCHCSLPFLQFIL